MLLQMTTNKPSRSCRHVHKDVPARGRALAAQAQDPRGATLAESPIPADPQVSKLRRPGAQPPGHALGEEAGLRVEPGTRWCRNRARCPLADAALDRLVPSLPYPYAGHTKRRLTMMAAGKMGPRSRRTRSSLESAAQGRDRVRCQNCLLIDRPWRFDFIGLSRLAYVCVRMIEVSDALLGG